MIDGRSVLAVIPARGGSVGILHKNVLPIAGVPMVARTIAEARVSGVVDRVVVSTDDPEIRRVALEAGAEVVDRPAALSGPKASSESALLHVLDTIRDSEGYEPDILVFLQATSPLTLAEDIDGTVRAMVEEDTQTALAVVPFHYFLWERDDGGDSVGINHDRRVRPMRQDREPQFLESGAIYVMDVPGFRASGHRFFGRTAMHVMPEERRFEVDEPVDMEVVELLVRDQERKNRRARLPSSLRAIVLDFDGVMTDNRVIVREDGLESVACDRGDGMGLGMLRQMGLELLVVSKEVNPVVTARCRKLNLPVMQGIEPKWPALRHWLEDRGISSSDVIYVGNDVNDLECLRAVGCAVVVGDAHRSVLSSAHIILTRSGGRGAVRELADLVLEKYSRGSHATRTD